MNALSHLLMNLGEATKESLRTHSTYCSLTKKESLPPFTNPPKQLVYVQTGWLTVAVQDKVVSLLKDGDIFMGPVLPVDEHDITVVLTAATSAEVRLMDRAVLLPMFVQHPDLMLALHEYNCERMTQIYLNMARQQATTLEGRLVAFLWSIGVPDRDGMRKIPPLTQSVIASCLGVGREEVNRKWRALAENHQLVKDQGCWMLSAQTSGAALGPSHASAD